MKRDMLFSVLVVVAAGIMALSFLAMAMGSSTIIQDSTYARNVNSIDLNYVITSCATKTVSDSNTLPIWFGVTLPADLSAVAICPQGDVYVNIGAAASAATWKLASGGYYRLPMTKTVADTMQIFAAAGTATTLTVERPR